MQIIQRGLPVYCVNKFYVYSMDILYTVIINFEYVAWTLYIMSVNFTYIAWTLCILCQYILRM